jgi:hypothetical protein
MLKTLPVLRYFMLAAVASFACGLSGCGSSGKPLYAVSGRVSFQGKPVTAGIIRFSNPEAAIDMTTEIHADGAYEVVMGRGAGLPQGIYGIAILPPMVDRPIGSAQPATAPVCLDIPARYRQPSTSGFTLTVQARHNVLDLDMQP